MESEAASSPASQLSDLKRAELLTHTRYPRPGPWYPPTFGAAAASFVAAYALPIWARIPILLAILAAFGAAVRVYTDRRGTIPDLKSAPTLLKQEMTYFFIGYALGIAVIGAAWALIAWWAASLVAFAVFTIGLTVYERRYAAAAHQTETEAGITA